MSKIILALKSRTIWTSVVLFLVNATPMFNSVLPPEWKALVDAILGLLVAYFHLNPSQGYTQA